MKLLLILSVVLLALWLCRSRRDSSPKQNQKSFKPAAPPLDMVRCTLCSVHVPVVGAVQGEKGAYCSLDHLRRAEH
jgi:uncharacterized protein